MGENKLPVGEKLELEVALELKPSGIQRHHRGRRGH